MGYKSFKEYIENRTVAEIMEDYGEQRDEWETLLVVKDGVVVKFRHRNGRTFFCTQYCPDDGKFKVNAELEKILSGKTVEKQMDYFYITKSEKISKTAYGEITQEQLKEHAVNLCEYDGIVKLLLNDEILVGAIVKGQWGDEVLLPGQPVCTYYASDNEGSGCNEREDYIYLIFTNRE